MTSSLIAVVVTYNRLPHLKATVARLLEAELAHLDRVLVVDNASTDGSHDWLASVADPRLSVLRLPENSGGAGGFEAGMRHAQAHWDPDWMVLMDDDGYPAPGALKSFHDADLDGIEAAAAAVYFPDGRICEMNRPSRNPFWHRDLFLATMRRGRSGFHIPDEAYQAGPRPIEVTSFVGFFISRAGIARVGFPDGGLFIYGDDAIYTLTLSGAGGRIVFLPQVRFEHDFTTIAGDVQVFRPLWKLYYHHRNLLLLYRQAAGLLFWPALFAIVPKWLMKLRHYKGQRRPAARLVWRAIRDGLLRRTQVPHHKVMAWAQAGSGVQDSTVEAPQQKSREEDTQK